MKTEIKRYSAVLMFLAVVTINNGGASSRQHSRMSRLRMREQTQVERSNYLDYPFRGRGWPSGGGWGWGPGPTHPNGFVPGWWRVQMAGGHYLSCYDCTYSYGGYGSPAVGWGSPPALGAPQPDCRFGDCSGGGQGGYEEEECELKRCKVNADCNCEGYVCIPISVVDFATGKREKYKRCTVKA